MVGVFSTLPNSQAGGSPLVGCPRLLIQHIRSYPHILGGTAVAQWLRRLLQIGRSLVRIQMVSLEFLH